MALISSWAKRNFSDPQVVFLVSILVVIAVVLSLLGHVLMPVIAALVIAFFLESFVVTLQRFKVSRTPSVVAVFTVFMALCAFIVFALIPVVIRQTTQLVQQIPKMISDAQAYIISLPSLYPSFLKEQDIAAFFVAIRSEFADAGQQFVAVSLSSAMGLVTLVVYIVLVPTMVFFFMKDKGKIVHWVGNSLPHYQSLALTVWRDVDVQIGNYIRGKFLEILIIWVVTTTTFILLGLEYALLMGVLVGLSVIIPYIGATVVTFPVLAVGYYQWGWSDDFMYLAVGYFIIQIIDGNVLVPLLFSEVVNLHPIAIIVAILVFGSIWGFWGVFFAIPLATVVQAVLTAWPNKAAAENPV